MFLAVGLAAVGEATDEPSLRPILECVVPDGGRYVAFFGYDNNGSKPLTVAFGSDNQFEGDAADRGQPVEFRPGRQRHVFSVPFSSPELTWKLRGRTAKASRQSSRCRVAKATIALKAGDFDVQRGVGTIAPGSANSCGADANAAQAGSDATTRSGCPGGRRGDVTDVDNNDYIGFRDVDFGDEPSFYKTFSVRVATLHAANHVELWLDAPSEHHGGKRIADLLLDARGGFERPMFQSAPLSSSPKGRRDLFLVFTGQRNEDHGTNGRGRDIGVFSDIRISPLPLPARDPLVLMAADYELQQGVINAGSEIRGVDAGDWIAFRGVDFGKVPTAAYFTAVAATPNDHNFLLVHRDALDGPVIAVLFLDKTGDDFSRYSSFRGAVVDIPTGKHDIFIEFGRGENSYGNDIGHFKRFQFGPFEEVATAEDGSRVEVREVVDESGSGLTAYEADFFDAGGSRVLATAVRFDPASPAIHTRTGDLCSTGRIVPPFFGQNVSISGVVLDPFGAPIDGFSGALTLKSDTHASLQFASVKSEQVVRRDFSLPRLGTGRGVCSPSADPFTNPFITPEDGPLTDVLKRIRPAFPLFRPRSTCGTRGVAMLTAVPACATGDRELCVGDIARSLSELLDLRGQSCMKKTCVETCREARNNCQGTDQVASECCELNCQAKCGKVPPADAVPVGCRIVVDATGVTAPPGTSGGMPQGGTNGGVVGSPRPGQNGGNTGGTPGTCPPGQVQTCDKQCVDPAMAKCFAFLTRVSPPSLVSPAPSPGAQTFACYGGFSRTAKTKQEAAACLLADMKIRFAGMGKVCLVHVTEALAFTRNSINQPYACKDLNQLDSEFCQRIPPTANSEEGNFFGECNLTDPPGGCRTPGATCKVGQMTVCCLPGETCTPTGCKKP